ncbi:MAG: signal peptidase II [candidate division Zixibacteria bacterium]|nr:signal peptidase II [candidate division Zixibacteria bacterium]
MINKQRPYLVVVFIVVFFDQLSKCIIHSTFFLGESKQVVGDLIRFTFIFNPGGAFGITFGSYWVYTILSLAAVIAVIAYFFKADKQPKFIKLCLALVVGGAAGNMIDRLIYRKVIDFIDIDIMDIIIPPFSFLSFDFSGLAISRWYTFNIADAAITIGLFGILIFLIFFHQSKQEIITADETEPIPDERPHT